MFITWNFFSLLHLFLYPIIYLCQYGLRNIYFVLWVRGVYKIGKTVSPNHREDEGEEDGRFRGRVDGEENEILRWSARLRRKPGSWQKRGPQKQTQRELGRVDFHVRRENLKELTLISFCLLSQDVFCEDNGELTFGILISQVNLPGPWSCVSPISNVDIWINELWWEQSLHWRIVDSIPGLNFQMQKCPLHLPSSAPQNVSRQCHMSHVPRGAESRRAENH